MPDTFGNLDDPTRTLLRDRAARPFSKDEISQRIRRDEEGHVRFRLSGGAAARGSVEARGQDEFAPRSPPPPEIHLIDPQDFDYQLEISADDAARAKPIDAALAPLHDVFANDGGDISERASARPNATLPAGVDHRPRQSPIKNQGERNTCVSHVALALLETAPHIPDDLSEQYAHFKFIEFIGGHQDQNRSVRTTDAAGFMARPDGRVCEEADWPYVSDQITINRAVAAGTYGPPPAAIGNQTFGYGNTKLIGDSGLEGESIKNTRFLESLLALGLDIAVGVWASWRDEDNHGVLRASLDAEGNPIGAGGHAIVLVGYDRPGQFFIAKNSYGSEWGHDGYGHFHYDFIRACAVYGFTVSDMQPPARPGGEL